MPGSGSHGGVLAVPDALTIGGFVKVALLVLVVGPASENAAHTLENGLSLLNHRDFNYYVSARNVMMMCGVTYIT